MYRKVYVYLALAIACGHLVDESMGRSNGPPTTACQSMTPIGHRTPPQPLNYNLASESSEFTPGELIIVTLSGSLPFRGIFLQVRDGDGPTSATRAVGSWAPSLRPGYRLVTCFESPEAAFGHSSSADKSADQTFAWLTPDSCDEGRTYLIRATVVRSFTTIQEDITLPITCAAPPPPPTFPPPTAPPVTNPPPPPQTNPPQTAPPTPPPTLPQTAPPTPPPTAPPTQPPTTAPRVLVTEQACRYESLNFVPVGAYDTSFEGGANYLAEWQNIGNRQWTRNSNGTASYSTGPSIAYDGTYYAYFEASSPAQPGDRAILQTRGELRGCFCLRFANSHVTSDRNHRLAVWVGDNEEFATTSGGASQWAVQNLQVDVADFSRIRIIAQRGTDWRGDIAIDRLQITPGLC